MDSAEELSPSLKRHVIQHGLVFVLMWFVFFPLLLFSESWGTMILMGLAYGYARYAASAESKLQDEIDRGRLAFRRYYYRSLIWIFWVIVIPHILLAVWMQRAFVWVLTGLLIVIGGALLLHEWLEVKALESEKPDHHHG